MSDAEACSLSPNKENGRKNSISGLLPEPRWFCVCCGSIQLLPWKLLWQQCSYWLFCHLTPPTKLSFLSCCPPVLLPSPCSRWLGSVEWQFFIFSCLLPSWPLLLTSRLEQQWLKPWDFVNLGSFEQQQRPWSSKSRKWCRFIFLLGVSTWKCYLCNHGSWTLCLIEVWMLCNWIGSPWEEFGFLGMC